MDLLRQTIDDTTSAAAPESLDAELDGQEELEGEQENAEQTQDDIEQAQQGDDLNDQKAAEPPPPPSDGGGGNGPDPNPRPGCGDSGSPGDNSPPSDNGGGCSIDDSSDDVNDGWSEPIVLDLNQNGEIELTALDQSNAFYDFDGDEYLNRVGWVSGDDGFLAIDIGGDGIIELGSEIAFADFGRYAVGQLELAEEVEAYLAEHGLLNKNLDFNGDGVVDVADFDSDRNGLISDLEGLRYFDSNVDGVIDSGDAVWSHLRVWQDYDQDGTSDAGEVSTLDGLGDASLNIASISLVSDANKVEGGEYGEGNVVYGLGSYTTADGGSSILGDVAFSASNIGYKEDADGTVRMKYDDVETVYRDDSGGYFDLGATVPETIAAYGGAGDDVFVNTGAGAANDVLMDGGAGDDELYGGAGDDWLSGGAGADKLYGGAGSDVIFVDADDLEVDGGDGFDVVLGSGAKGIDLDLGASSIEATRGTEADDKLDARGSNDGVIVDGGAGDDELYGGAGDDRLAGGAGADNVHGGDGDDVLIVDSDDTFSGGDGIDTVIFTDDVAQNVNISDWGVEGVKGGSGDDIFRTDSDVAAILWGGAGNDQLYGSWGEDVLRGGEGRDTLAGGYGNDTYFVSKGSGVDIIQEGFSRAWVYFSKSGYLSQDDKGVWRNHDGDITEPVGAEGQQTVQWDYYSNSGWVGTNELGERIDPSGAEFSGQPSGAVGVMNISWRHLGAWVSRPPCSSESEV